MTAAFVKPLSTDPNSTSLTIEIVRVTPAMAEKWLGKNRRNRNVSQKEVARYAQAMTAGEWLITGEAIKFAHNGDLLDGQHRLLAIVQSGRPISMPVVRGLHESTQDVLDTGRARTASDALSIHGFSNPTLMAAAAKVVLLYESGLFYVDNQKQQVSHRQILEFVQGNSMLAFAATRARIVTKGCGLRPAIAAMTFYELVKKDDQKAIEFFERLADGVSLPAGSPILALRARLQTLRDERSLLPTEALVSMVFRTWNAWRAGRTLATLPLYKNGQFIPCPEPK